MGVKDVLSRKEGVIVGDDVLGEFPNSYMSGLSTDRFQLSSSMPRRSSSPSLPSYVLQRKVY